MARSSQRADAAGIGERPEVPQESTLTRSGGAPGARLRVEAEQRSVRNIVQFYLTLEPGRRADSCGMLAVMSNEATYSPDLYRGTAEYYDRFRLSYPAAMISDPSGAMPSSSTKVLSIFKMSRGNRWR